MIEVFDKTRRRVAILENAYATYIAVTNTQLTLTKTERV